MPRRIFISCGQRTDEERNLGAAVAELVKSKTQLSPYFAEEQSSLAGLTTHIFNALNDAAGFIAILHRRGSVMFGPESGRIDLIRASVWVEQEIAIAAFIQQSLGRPLPVAAYIEEGIALEGVRQYVLLHPKPFRSYQDVLEDLEIVLSSWQVTGGEAGVEVVPVQREWAKNWQGYRYDEFSVTLRNKGEEPVSKYVVEIEFPRDLLESSTHYTALVPDRSDDAIAFFRTTEEHQRGRTPIQPGDSLKVFGTEFKRFETEAFPKPVVLRLRIPGLPAQERIFQLV